MTIFFSPTTGAFYESSFWDAPLPDDIAVVSAEDHAALLDAASTGKVIQAGPDGAPIAVDPPTPSAETLAERARRRRDREIAAVRWRLDRHDDELALGREPTLSAEAIQAVREYVQALRDLTLQPNFPAEIEWPVLPANLQTETL